MGSAVSAVVSPVAGLAGGALSPVAGAVGGTAGAAIAPLLQDIASIIPDVPIADQSAVQSQINQATTNTSIANNQSMGLQGAANSQIGSTQGSIANANNALATAQQTA